MKKVRIGIIGSGWGLKVQLPAFRTAGLEVTALWARDEQKCETLKKETNVSLVTSDWKAVATSEQVDLVTIVTPPFLHAEQTKFAVAAGKHVLCDKPTALNAQEAKEMVDSAALAKEKNPAQLNLIDFELRFLKFFQTAREWILQGAIGSVTFVDAEFKVRRTSIAPAGDWWYEEKSGGGILGAIGSHWIDYLSWISGHRVSEVSATLATTQLERTSSVTGAKQDISVDDFVTANFKFGQSTARGTLRIDASYTVQTPSRRILVAGTKGTLVVDVDRWTTTLLGPSGETVKEFVEQREDVKLENAFAYGTYLLGKAIHDHFNKVNDDLTKHGATIEDGYYVQRVMDAARKSNKTESAWIKI